MNVCQLADTPDIPNCSGVGCPTDNRPDQDFDEQVTFATWSRSVSALAATFQNPELSRFEVGYLGFAFAEHATWLALLVFALERGGPREVGAVALVVLLPGALLAPFAAYAGDRFAPRRALAVGYSVQALANIGVAVAMAHGNASSVYGAAIIATTAVTFSRPVMLTLLPNATRTPAELVSANAVTATVERVGALVGPLVAGLLMYLASPGAVFVAGAIATTGAALLALSARTVRTGVPPIDVEARDLLPQVFGGFAALRHSSHLRVFMFVIACAALVQGIADVLFVTYAEIRFDSGGGKAGVFNAAFGVGAMVAAASSGTALRSPAAALPILRAGAIVCAGVAALSLTVGVGGSATLFMAIGGGTALLHLAAALAVQRRVTSSVTCRVFGIAEGLHMTAMAAGSAGFAILVARFDLARALLTAATLVGVLIIGGVVALRRLGEHSAEVDERVVDALSADPILSPLPSPALERLARVAVEVSAEPGVPTVRQGDEGDRFYIVTGGALEVWKDGQLIRTLLPGASFGEMALIRDEPRAATVVAVSPTRLIALERDDFLEALTGHPRSLGVAHAKVDAFRN